MTGWRSRLTPAAKRALLRAHAKSQEAGASYIGPEHILAAVVEDPSSGAAGMLGPEGAGARRDRGGPGGAGGGSAGGGSSATPTLDEYGRDLTEEARAGRLDPVVGRAQEIEQTVEILSRRSKNNPVLLGDPGVGKTAIVEGLCSAWCPAMCPRPCGTGGWSPWTCRDWWPVRSTAESSRSA
ncbi:ATP-dependent Clp protease ATP-binding subunit OS=Streptomyces rimosus subsp. rimosus (strain ATCC / DSM 40260 / JCM 4667 / NRRL 2234) OX=1265868 GN=SRIM_033070 PE=3 SV=1 [Streptomyces rimosus subsp. rimosus]